MIDWLKGKGVGSGGYPLRPVRASLAAAEGGADEANRKEDDRGYNTHAGKQVKLQDIAPYI